jgi:hypothetical protein
MSNDKVFELPVPLQEAEAVAMKLNESIDNQVSFMAGTRVINGRYILYYDLA